MTNANTSPQLTFNDAVESFREETDNPRAYLERCVATLDAREPVVKAWVNLRLDAARREADASADRYRQGRVLSAIDGMPIGLKDLIATSDLPTGLGIRGNDSAITDYDSASVLALRAAGAIIVGKTTTTELGGGWPSPTTNPFDPRRTPGGSSSGSAAAVGAQMVPVAIGTQVGGSVLRPAAYCGNFALKPTMGALHRGERLGLSHACLGIHAGSLHDMWVTAAEIAARSGGDPGYPGMFGTPVMPRAKAPLTLGIMEGPGWEITTDTAKGHFENLLLDLQERGVRLIRSGQNEDLGAFNTMLSKSLSATMTIIAYESRTDLANLMRRMADKLTPATHQQYQLGLGLSIEDYREALNVRQEMRECHARLAVHCDAIICLAVPDIAPLIDNPDRPPHEFPTGNPMYNIIPSLLGAPALNLPLLTSNDMPLGVQLMGQPHSDEGLVAHGAWITDQALGENA